MKVALRLAALFLEALYLSFAVREFAAAHLAKSAEQKSLERAAQLAPWQDHYFHLQGRYYLFAMQDAAVARKHLERAVDLNQHNVRAWLDLALACRVIGDVNCEEHAVKEAALHDPKTPAFAWEVGNFELVHGNREAALSHIAFAASVANEAVAPAVALLWRLIHSVDEMLRRLPQAKDPYNEWADLLMSNNEVNELDEAISKSAEMRRSFDRDKTAEIADFLLRNDRIASAVLLWNDAANRFPELARKGGNELVNGDFENELVQLGFGWKMTQLPASQMSLDPGEFASGGQSLRITLSGNAPPTLISQQVPVEAGQRYTLEYKWKTESFAGAYPPVFVVSDKQSGSHAEGPPLAPSAAWNSGRLSFIAQSDGVVNIALTEPMPWSVLKGKLWLDNVILRRVRYQEGQ